jgi:beta-lactamase regulating signal transducer with metallopeptidase domain
MNVLIHVAGWSLLHFVWQGTVIGLAAAAALRIVPTAFPRARYAAASLALALMLASPAVTAAVLASSAWVVPRPGASTVDASAGVVSRAFAAGDAGGSQQAAFDSGSRMRSTTILTFVVVTWLAGVLLCVTRLAGGWWRVRRLHLAALTLPQSTWHETAARVADALGLRRRVHIADSEMVDSPTLIGWLRPVILLPVAAVANLTPAQVEAILAHELAHVRRHDYVVNLVQTAAETLLFYHPAVWWVSRQIRTEREHCCDDVAVATCGNAADYAAALEELETRRARDGGFALAATGGSLLERVRRLLHVPADDQRPAASVAVMMALVLLIIVVSGGLQHLPASHVNQASSAGQVRQAPPLPPPPPPPPGAGPVGWELLETASFEISYPPELASEVERIGREAEAAYSQLKLDLRHELAFKPRIVLFATRLEMERALAAGIIPGGVEQLFQGHLMLVMSLDKSPARLRGDLVHEITHVFGFDILPSSRRDDVPAWVPEGLAEHERGEWDASDAALLGDLIRSGGVPRISTVGVEGVPGNPRLNQILGHAAFDFIVSRAGKDGLRRFLMAVRQAPAGGLVGVYTATFGTTPDDFDRGFEEYLRGRFATRR